MNAAGIAELVHALARSDDFRRELGRVRVEVAAELANFTPDEHLAIANALPDGFERICLTVVYYETAKQESYIALEVWTHFLIQYRTRPTLCREDFNEFSNSACGQLLNLVTPDEPLLDSEDSSSAQSPGKRLRLAYLKLAHDVLADYLQVIRETRLRIAGLLGASLVSAVDNDQRNAASRNEVVTRAPEFVKQVDAGFLDLGSLSEQFRQTAEGVRAYLEREATTEAAALSVATLLDQEVMEGQVRLHIRRGDPARAWAALQRHRSRVVLGQLAHMASGSADPRMRVEVAAWLRQFRGAGGDALEQFHRWLVRERGEYRRPGNHVGPYGNLAGKPRADVPLVEFVTTGDECFAFVSPPGSDRPEVIPIPLQRRAIDHVVRKLIVGSSRLGCGMFDGGLGVDCRRDATVPELEELYPLVSWLPSVLGGFTRLWLVPYGLLHFMPFHVLPSPFGTGARYLIEDASLAFLPAAGLLPHLMATNPRRSPSEPSPRTAFLAGAVYAQENQPALVKHFRELADMFSNVECLLGEEASLDKILSRCGSKSWGICYLHGHGRDVPGDASSNAIVLSAPGQLPAPEGVTDECLLTARRLADAPLTGDLAVLSSCLSARGDIRSGDEMVGLARSLLLRGFSGIVTALWIFDTEAGRALLTEFIRAWAVEGLPKADALAKAQRMMLSGALRSDWRHPYYWAPFTLTGDWL